MVAFQSCVTVREIITLTQNKSGHVIYELDLSSLTMFGIMNSNSEGYQMEILQQADKLNKQLNALEGISNVVLNHHKQSGLIRLEFDFDTPRHLNEMYYALSNNQYHWWSPDILKVKRHYVARKNFSPHIQRWVKKNKNEDPQIDQFIRWVDFETVIHTPTPVKRVVASSGHVVGERKVTMKRSFSRIVKNQQSTRFKVAF